MVSVGECDLGADNRFDPMLDRGLVEPDDPIETVVVGDRQGFEPESGGFGGELFGM